MTWPHLTFRTVDEELAFLRAHARVARLVDEILEDCLARGLGLEAALDVFLSQCARLLGAADGFVQLRGTHGPVLTRRLGARWFDPARLPAEEGAHPMDGGTLLLKRLDLGPIELGGFGLFVTEVPADELAFAAALVDAMGEQLDSALFAFVALADGTSPLQRLDELAVNDRFRPRTRFGRYELLVPIGSGGMAQVFVARQSGPEGVGRLVALKRILPHLLAESDVVQQFLDEAQIGLKLAHPNLATVYDFGRTPAGYYLAMELVRGASLYALLSRAGRLEPRFAAGIVTQALRALHAAHELRGEDGRFLALVHRDLSPHNLMIGFEGLVKVLDFGIAKTRSQRSKTVVGALKGKPVYMSPEQALGRPVDRRSDLFSAGLILYEGITGVRPFRRDGDVATLDAIIREPAPSDPRIPPELWSVIDRALSKDPAKRFESASVMSEAIAEALDVASEGEIAGLVQTEFADAYRAARGWDSAAARPQS